MKAKKETFFAVIWVLFCPYLLSRVVEKYQVDWFGGFTVIALFFLLTLIICTIIGVALGIREYLTTKPKISNSQ